MKTWHYIILTVVLLIVIIVGFGYFKLTGSSTKVAILHIEEGQVQVNQGKGWLTASDEMDLSENDIVKTGSDGMASIILYESAIISMEPNTEINLAEISKEHILLKQNSGETWNKFTGLAGLEGLSIETPTTVATVRGTAFGVSMESIIVGEGTVEVKHGGEKIMVEKEEILELPPVAAKVASDMVAENAQITRKMIKRTIVQADREQIAKKMTRTIKVMNKIREMEVAKHGFLAKRLQNKYDVSDDSAKGYLERADKGEFDLDEIQRKSPVNIASVDKLKAMTEEIIAQKREINRVLKRPVDSGLEPRTIDGVRAPELMDAQQVEPVRTEGIQRNRVQTDVVSDPVRDDSVYVRSEPVEPIDEPVILADGTVKYSTPPNTKPISLDDGIVKEPIADDGLVDSAITQVKDQALIDATGLVVQQ